VHGLGDAACTDGGQRGGSSSGDAAMQVWLSDRSRVLLVIPNRSVNPEYCSSRVPAQPVHNPQRQGVRPLAADFMRGARLPPLHDSRRWRANTALHGQIISIASHVLPLLRAMLAFSLLWHKEMRNCSYCLSHHPRQGQARSQLAFRVGPGPDFRQGGLIWHLEHWEG
jgi:hypothetical protein